MHLLRCPEEGAGQYTGPGADQCPDGDEDTGGERIAPADVEGQRPDADDQQGLQQGQQEIRDRLAEHQGAGGTARAGRGRGMRALLHAAFSIALARYCLDGRLPHLGFLVLDSPLVTYKGPDFDADRIPRM
ncbi:hypothetical protein ACRAWF_40525 [Streptomyces sp. L7]